MSYKLLPVLKNPVKWLKGVKVRHSEKLPILENYDVKDLESNPYAQILSDFRFDVSRKSFPIGDMVQIIVDKKNDEYWLKPVLAKPTKGQNPARYVLNSEDYIEFLSLKQFLPMPFKYMVKSPSLASRTKILPRFTEEVKQMYVDKIKKLLENVISEEQRKFQGILLLPGDTTTLDWQEDQLIMTTGLVKANTYIGFNKNKELARLLILLANFEAHL